MPLVFSIVLILISNSFLHSADAQERRVRDLRIGGVETQQPTCRCCISNPSGGCCRDSCNIASLSRNMSRVAPGVFAVAAASDKRARKSNPPDPLRTCMFREALKVANYSESADAKAFFELPSVAACDGFLPTLLRQRRDILAAYGSGAVTPRQTETSRQYVDICLTPAASIYKPSLSSADIQKIAERMMLLVSNGGRPYCHGFRVNGHVITADHCLRGVPSGSAVSVRAISSSVRLSASVILRGGEDKSRQPEKDYALLKLAEPYGTDSVTDVSWLGDPIPNARLLLVQANAYKQIASGIQFDSGFDHLLTIEDNPACRVFGISPQGFLLNGCQSDSGTSGGPYIQKDVAGKLRLVGVHGGQTGLLKAADLKDCEVSLPNYGVRVPLTDLRKLLGATN